MQKKYTIKEHLARQLAEQASLKCKEWNNGESLYESDCYEFADLFQRFLLEFNGYEQ